MQTKLPLLLLFLIAFALPGCKATQSTQHPKPQRGLSMGFGLDENRAEAKEEAWDNAIERIKATGVDRFRIVSFKSPSNSMKDGKYSVEVLIEYEVVEDELAPATPSSPAGAEIDR